MSFHERTFLQPQQRAARWGEGGRGGGLDRGARLDAQVVRPTRTDRLV